MTVAINRRTVAAIGGVGIISFLAVAMSLLFQQTRDLDRQLRDAQHLRQTAQRQLNDTRCALRTAREWIMVAKEPHRVVNGRQLRELLIRQRECRDQTRAATHAAAGPITADATTY